LKGRGFSRAADSIQVEERRFSAALDTTGKGTTSVVPKKADSMKRGFSRTRRLQFLLIAATFAGLIIYGLICDKREHFSSAKPENDAQESLPFPASDSPDHEHRGAAMSRL
jgi:hypothetical protein